AEPQRPVYRLGLGDHDLPGLVRQVDRAIRVWRAKLNAPEHVQVIDEFMLADTERRCRLSKANNLPADHVGHQSEQALQPFGRRASPSRASPRVRPAHASTPLSLRITASRRSTGSITTTSAPNDAM